MTAFLACDMAAIPPTEREEHQRMGLRLVAAATTIRESGHGMAFELPADEYQAAVQFVARERLCCPFLQFSLNVSPDRGPVWLYLDGPPGTAEFLRSELKLPSPPG